MKRTCFLLIVFLTSLTFIHAQTTAHEMEALLRSRAVSYSQAARFVLEASSQATLSSQQQAFQYAQENGLLPVGACADGAARLDGIAFLLMNSFGLPGGLMYYITKDPHYAYRELIHKNIIQGRVLGSTPVSGEQLLFLTGRMLSYVEN